MNNILIVDDDVYILDTIISMVQWENTTITGIFTAKSAEEAMNIFREAEIHILLCDIEMQELSGLDLAAWCRAEGYPIQLVFITSHADFYYARTALTLGSFEYLLKPVSFQELESVIIKAAEKNEIEKKNREVVSQYSAWEQKISQRKEIFWRNVVVASQSSFDFWEQAQALGVFYGKDISFTYVRLEVYDYYTIYEKLQSDMFSIRLCNLAEEVFAAKGYHVEVIFRTDSEEASQWNIIFTSSGKEEETGLSMKKLCQVYISQIYETMSSVVGCYIGRTVLWDKIREEARLVINISKDIERDTRFVMSTEEAALEESVYHPPVFEEYKILLKECREKELLKEINQWLEYQKVNANMLKTFIGDFLQMQYELFRENHIQVPILTNLSEFENAVKSVRNTKLFLENKIRQTIEYMRAGETENSVTDAIADYINDHLEENINRNTFSEMFYMNPEYLGKMFKKEKGIAIGEYLLIKRIERARILLSTSKKSISHVALEVGYSNFSYFSKLFYKATGLTPNDYRKQSQ